MKEDAKRKFDEIEFACNSQLEAQDNRLKEL